MMASLCPCLNLNRLALLPAVGVIGLSVAVLITGCEQKPEANTPTPDFELYYRISESIYPRVFDDYDGLTEAEKIFFHIDWLDLDVNNGGWHQWYHNFQPDERAERIEQTIKALQAIGTHETSTMARTATHYLDNGADMDHPGLYKLDRAFWDRPEPLTVLTQDWARERLDQFNIEAAGTPSAPLPENE